ncbi:MAG: hypothetical protein WC333_01350 [Dehalococcoidia bacterium]
MKKDTKTLLFEMMEKTVPGFKSTNEQQAVSGVQQPIAGDVKNVQNTVTTSQQTANSRIDTPDEFSQAFRVWFSSLGFNPQNRPIAIGRVTIEVTKIMKELGYR